MMEYKQLNLKDANEDLNVIKIIIYIMYNIQFTRMRVYALRLFIIILYDKSLYKVINKIF